MGEEEQKVIEFAKMKHYGQTRIGGDEYITHPIAVADILKKKGLTDDVYVYSALLHDILEDTDATEDEILNLTNENVLKTVKALTKQKNCKIKTI